MVSFRNMPSCCTYAFLSSIALWWVNRAHKDAFIILLMPCSVFCEVWNLLTKLAMFTWVPSYLLYLFGSWSVRDFCSMHLVYSCHVLFCYDKFLKHVLLLLWTLLPDAVSAMFSIFTKSVKLISFALLPCVFEPVILWSSRSSVFIVCQASLIHHCHMLYCSVGLL